MRTISKASLLADPVGTVFDTVREGGLMVEEAGVIVHRLQPEMTPDDYPATIEEFRAEVAGIADA